MKNTVHGSQWLRSNADDEDSKVSNLVSLLRFDKLFVNLLIFVTPPPLFPSKKSNMIIMYKLYSNDEDVGAYTKEFCRMGYMIYIRHIAYPVNPMFS